MKISITPQTAFEHDCDCVVVGIYDKNKLSPSAEDIDRQSKGYLSKVIKRGGFNGAAGQILMLQDVAGTKAERTLLVGLGKEKEQNAASFRKATNSAIQALNSHGVQKAASYLQDIKSTAFDSAWMAMQTAQLVQASLYRFTHTKSNDQDKPSLKQLSLGAIEKASQNQAKKAIAEGSAIGIGMNLSRELGNLPGNICTPTYLASEAKQLARQYEGIKTQVLEQKDMEKLGMGSLLSVSRGSRQPPKLIVMQYNGGKAGSKPVVLVGKGITFDSGGISIKPSAAMDEMKFDMCGAASVIGTFKTLGELKPAINVVGIVPSCENLPDGDANKPGDVVTSMSGQTIEILNTDAEGRLILCDALTYADKFKPRAVIDIATLTGACVVALGKHACGLLSNDDELAENLLNAGKYSHDRAWQLPLWEEYQDQLKTNFADMANVGGRDAGTITAACFLARFTKKYKWAHLDIAGVAWDSGANKGATGRPVPLLVNYLLHQGKR